MRLRDQKMTTFPCCTPMLHSFSLRRECCILLALWSQTTGRLLLCRTPAAYRAGGGPGTHRSAACPPYSPPIGGARQRAWRAPTHTTRKPTSSPPPKISGCLGGRGVPSVAGVTGGECPGPRRARCPQNVRAQAVVPMGICPESACDDRPRKTSASTDGRRLPSLGPAGRPRARPAARRSQRLQSNAHVSRPPTPRWLDSPLPSPFSADPMLRVHRPQNAAAIGVKVPRPGGPPGACSCRMVGGDQLSFTGAMGGARLVMIPTPVYKRQPSNFARRLAEIPVPAAGDVNATARPKLAAPMLPAAQPGGRACGAASRHLSAAVATRGGLAAAWRVVVSSMSPHHRRQDRVF